MSDFEEFCKREHDRRVAHLVRFVNEEEFTGSLLGLAQDIFGFCEEHAEPIVVDTIKVLALQNLSRDSQPQKVYDDAGRCIGQLVPYPDGYDSKTDEAYQNWYTQGFQVPDAWMKFRGLK